MRTPTWIQQIKDDKAIQESKTQAELAQRQAAEAVAKTNSSFFWNDFQSGLEQNIDALPEIGMRGTVSRFEINSFKPEESCHVEVILLGLIPKSAGLHIHFRKSSHRFDCVPAADGKTFSLDLVVIDNALFASGPRGKPFTASEAADFVVRSLAENIQ
jgi:hypothetical protein